MIRGYFYAGVAALIVGMGALSYHFYNRAKLAGIENERLTGELVTVKQVNQQNVDTIARITAFREETNKVLTTVTQRLDEINKAQVDTTNALADLRANDVTAREYLDTSIPDSVRGMLNKRPASGR